MANLRVLRNRRVREEAEAVVVAERVMDGARKRSNLLTRKPNNLREHSYKGTKTPRKRSKTKPPSSKHRSFPTRL